MQNQTIDASEVTVVSAAELQPHEAIQALLVRLAYYPQEMLALDGSIQGIEAIVDDQQEIITAILNQQPDLINACMFVDPQAKDPLCLAEASYCQAFAIVEEEGKTIKLALPALDIGARDTAMKATPLSSQANAQPASSVNVDQIKFDEERNIKQSLLHIAVRHGSVKWVKKLLQLEDIQVDVKDELGNTPLHYAFGPFKSEIRTLLLQAGASVTAVNANDESPVIYAIRMGDSEGINALVAQDANVLTEAAKQELSSVKSQAYHVSENSHNAYLEYLSTEVLADSQDAENFSLWLKGDLVGKKQFEVSLGRFEKRKCHEWGMGGVKSKRQAAEEGVRTLVHMGYTSPAFSVKSLVQPVADKKDEPIKANKPMSKLPPPERAKKVISLIKGLNKHLSSKGVEDFHELKWSDQWVYIDQLLKSYTGMFRHFNDLCNSLREAKPDSLENFSRAFLAGIDARLKELSAEPSYNKKKFIEGSMAALIDFFADNLNILSDNVTPESIWENALPKPAEKVENKAQAAASTTSTSSGSPESSSPVSSITNEAKFVVSTLFAEINKEIKKRRTSDEAGQESVSQETKASDVPATESQDSTSEKAASATPQEDESAKLSCTL